MNATIESLTIEPVRGDCRHCDKRTLLLPNYKRQDSTSAYSTGSEELFWSCLSCGERL